MIKFSPKKNFNFYSIYSNTFTARKFPACIIFIAREICCNEQLNLELSKPLFWSQKPNLKPTESQKTEQTSKPNQVRPNTSLDHSCPKSKLSQPKVGQVKVGPIQSWLSPKLPQSKDGQAESCPCPQ